MGARRARPRGRQLLTGLLVLVLSSWSRQQAAGSRYKVKESSGLCVVVMAMGNEDVCWLPGVVVLSAMEADTGTSSLMEQEAAARIAPQGSAKGAQQQ